MKSKLKIIIPVGIALIAIALAFVFIRFTPEETTDISGVIDTAQQYLIDQKYEQAIAEFEKAIQIDPMNADAYIGIAQAYKAIGDTEKAIKWLQKGYDLTGDTSLKDEIDRLSVRSADVETSVETTAAETTTAPIEYSNEELEEVLLRLIEDPNAVIEQSKLDAIKSVEILGADCYAVNQYVCDKYGILSYGGIENTIKFKDGTEKELNVDEFQNLEFLNQLKNIKSIDINYANIIDISALENMTNLERLFLEHNQISEISVLGNLTNLKSLSLDNNQISDINALSNLTNLTTLLLEHNQISDISALSNLTNLISLDLSSNPISDISALSDLTKLEYFNLVDSHVSDISTLSNFTKLTVSFLQSNQISDISSLSNLTNLEALYLYGNPISESDIEELKKALPNCEINY